MAGLDELAGLGVRISLQGHHPVMAAWQATYETLRALREGTTPSELDGIPGKELMDKYSRVESYHNWINRHLESMGPEA